MVTISDSTQGMAARAAFRAENENPRDPRCRLALQRICGTCQHYQGALKPERLGHDPAAGDTAECAYFKTEKHRRARAWDCLKWARKGAGDV